MILIGENLNVMSKRVAEALRQQDRKVIQEVAVAVAGAGVHMLDINLGPARKGGAELMDWVVTAVQEVVDLPLSLDTTNVEAIEAGLKVCRKKALVNSVSARPERIEALLPLVRDYGASFIALTIGPEGIPRDANERGLLAAQLIAEAAAYGIPEDDVWLDPIVLPVNTQQAQVQGCTEFAMMLTELAPNCKSTCGLSNVSNGVPKELRGILNRTYLIMLRRYGLYSAIVDAFDEDLKVIAAGGRPDLESLVAAVMDGTPVDPSALNEEAIAYYKTARVLAGLSLYSDSWLEL